MLEDILASKRKRVKPRNLSGFSGGTFPSPIHSIKLPCAFVEQPNYEQAEWPTWPNWAKETE